MMLDSSKAVVGTEQSSVQWEDTKLEPGFIPTADRSANAPDTVSYTHLTLPTKG